MIKKAARGVLQKVGLYWPVRDAWFNVKQPPWWLDEQKRIAFRKTLAPRGSLVFDIGANAGEYADDFLRLGCRVLSVEPNPNCAAQLQTRFAANPRFHLVQAALGAAPGKIKLHLADASAISSCSPEWIDRVRSSGRFKGHDWNQTVDVPMTTLDALIAQHGAPSHTKIDVEGFESQVLKGLSQHAGLLSFEFTPEVIQSTADCLQRLASIGYREFNYTFHEATQFALPTWLNPDQTLARLQTLAGNAATPGGDLFAR